MRDSIADYLILRPLDDPDRPGGRFVAMAPARLGLGAAEVVVEVGPGDPADVLPELQRWAAASPGGDGIGAGWPAGGGAGTGLVVPIEVGAVDSPGDRHVWSSRLAALDEGWAGPAGAIAGAARGLAALHRSGTVHGAVSAGRVLPTRDGGVLDLPPLSGRRVEGLQARVTRPGALDGLAPEVARGEPPTPASDVWALGACMHLALTGRRIHAGLDDAVLLSAVQRAVWEPPQIVPGERADLIAACCSMDPDDRPTAAMVAAALASRP